LVLVVLFLLLLERWLHFVIQRLGGCFIGTLMRRRTTTTTTRDLKHGSTSSSRFPDSGRFRNACWDETVPKFTSIFMCHEPRMTGLPIANGAGWGQLLGRVCRENHLVSAGIERAQRFRVPTSTPARPPSKPATPPPLDDSNQRCIYKGTNFRRARTDPYLHSFPPRIYPLLPHPTNTHVSVGQQVQIPTGSSTTVAEHSVPWTAFQSSHGKKFTHSASLGIPVWSGRVTIRISVTRFCHDSATTPQ
jgi:hypothetical protein